MDELILSYIVKSSDYSRSKKENSSNAQLSITKINMSQLTLCILYSPNVVSIVVGGFHKSSCFSNRLLLEIGGSSSDELAS